MGRPDGSESGYCVLEPLVDLSLSGQVSRLRVSVAVHPVRCCRPREAFVDVVVAAAVGLDERGDCVGPSGAGSKE